MKSEALWRTTEKHSLSKGFQPSASNILANAMWGVPSFAMFSFVCFQKFW